MNRFPGRYRRFAVVSAVFAIGIACAWLLSFIAVPVGGDKYALEIDDGIREQVQNIANDNYGNFTATGFTVVSVKIHAAYRQKDVTRAFVEVMYTDCEIFPANAIRLLRRIYISVSMTYKQDSDGTVTGYAIAESSFDEDFDSSVRKLCVLPNGRKIEGLATRMLSGFGNDDSFRARHESEILEYVTFHGLDDCQTVFFSGNDQVIAATVLENDSQTFRLERLDSYRGLVPDVWLDIDFTASRFFDWNRNPIKASDIAVGSLVRMECTGTGCRRDGSAPSCMLRVLPLRPSRRQRQ